MHVEAECSREQQAEETRWLTEVNRKYGMPKRNFWTMMRASMLGASKPRRMMSRGSGAVMTVKRSPSCSTTVASAGNGAGCDEALGCSTGSLYLARAMTTRTAWGRWWPSL